MKSMIAVTHSILMLFAACRSPLFFREGKLQQLPYVSLMTWLCCIMKVDWAHIDIAGPAWAWGDAANATGYGAALLAQWAIQESQ